MRVGTSGTDIGNAAFGLAQALISYIGVTDANGSALGITLVSGPLANEPSYDGLVVKILSGPAAGQVRTIEVHNGNTLTVGVPFTNPAGAAQQITIGTLFVILSSLAGGGGVSKLAGVPQNFTKNINSAANAGDVVVATVTAQSCFIKRIVLRSNGATTADLTNAAIYGGAGKVVTFIDSVTGVRANIAAVDQQVSWGGAATLPATKTIVISLTGTGATAVNLQVDIELFAIVDGGYLA